MKLRFPILLIVLSLLAGGAFAAEPPAKEGVIILGPEGVIPQIATGGGAFFMEFQFVNASSEAASVRLSFFDNDGAPMSVPYVQDGAVTIANTLVETVSPNGVEFSRTVLDAEERQIGYAEIHSSPREQISVQTTFNQVVEGRPLFQAYIPEATGADNAFFLPSVTAGGRTASLAVVSRTDQDVTYIGRNRNGVELCRAGRPFLEGEHRAFIIRDMLSCMDGVRGVVEVRGSDSEGVLHGVGITAQDDGAFVTQPPVPEPPPRLR